MWVRGGWQAAVEQTAGVGCLHCGCQCFNGELMAAPPSLLVMLQLPSRLRGPHIEVSNFGRHNNVLLCLQE
jgi:hypothetical protein